MPAPARRGCRVLPLLLGRRCRPAARADARSTIASSPPSATARTARRRWPLSRSTLQRLLARGEAEGTAQEFQNLAAEVREAEAAADVDVVGVIRRAAAGGDCRAAGWLLERGHPARSGRRPPTSCRDLTACRSRSGPMRLSTSRGCQMTSSISSTGWWVVLPRRQAIWWERFHRAARPHVGSADHAGFAHAIVRIQGDPDLDEGYWGADWDAPAPRTTKTRSVERAGRVPPRGFEPRFPP